MNQNDAGKLETEIHVTVMTSWQPTNRSNSLIFQLCLLSEIFDKALSDEVEDARLLLFFKILRTSMFVSFSYISWDEKFYSFNKIDSDSEAFFLSLK